MKNDVRTAASNSVESMIVASMKNLIPTRTDKKNDYTIDTGVVDEQGRPVYAVINWVVKSNDATDRSPAFDLEAAIQAREDYKPRTTTKKDTAAEDVEKAARRAKHEANQKIVEAWCMENLTDKPMTTTEIKSAIPEMEEITVMQVGTYLKNIIKDNDSIKCETVKGKPMYSRV